MPIHRPDTRARSERLMAALEEILQRIVDDETEQVILFGSAARGDVGSSSDLDLLVVRRDNRRPAERVDDLYRRARPTVALDLLVYTPAELAALRQSSSFVRRILQEGRIVHDRSGTLARTGPP
jgi:predicted nucleotidyltransferase